MQRLALHLFVTWLAVAASPRLFADDYVELTTGAKVHGTILAHEDREITVEVVLGGKSYTRKYPREKVRGVNIKGTFIPMASAPNKTTRSKQEIQELIERSGRELPEWFESTQLAYPPTLDLDWP